MITAIITLAVIVIVMALVWWILAQFPLPEPIGKVVTIVFVVICAIVLIYFLLGIAGDVQPLRLR